MRKIKKFIGVVLAIVMSMSMSMVAFAGGITDKEVEGYGLLFGSVDAINNVAVGYAYVDATTIISNNPDNAYLKSKIEIQNVQGKVMESAIKTSDRGWVYLLGTFTLGEDLKLTSFDGVHAIYAAHNVQGGSRYPAQVVYTVTTQIPN